MKPSTLPLPDSDYGRDNPLSVRRTSLKLLPANTNHGKRPMGSRHSQAIASVALLTVAVYLLPGFPAFAAQPDAPTQPKALQEWSDPAYSERYYLKVEPPGEAGNVNIHRDAFTAVIVLPLSSSKGPDGTSVPDHILLMGEDGHPQSVLVRPAASGLGMEVLFRSQPGLRRFCLYAGDSGKAQRSSPTDFWPTETSVELQARTAPADFIATPNNPLTLTRFLKMEETVGDLLGGKQVVTINQRENPFIEVYVDALGHVQRVQNPPRYAALYEAFLRAPVAGKYVFSVDTPGAAQLQIDGLSVLSLDAPDAARVPFAEKKSVDLTAGLHRVVLHYAEANANGRTNAEQATFGVRLHWQPPWAKSLMCIPPQAFPKAMPAVVTRHEISGGNAAPYLHLELLGQVRCASHLGPRGVQDRALLCARMIDGDGAFAIQAANAEIASETISNVAFAWVPVGADVTVGGKSAGQQPAPWTRTLKFAPPEAADVLDVQGEIEIKSAPDFLYVDDVNHDRDETAHFHIQSALSPPPEIVPKERIESKLLPPAARPMGEFSLRWQFACDGDAAALKHPADDVVEATPFENGRRRQRASFKAAALEELAKSGQWKLVFTLSIGGVDCESIVVRLLHAEKPWPGKVIAGPGELFFESAKPAPALQTVFPPEADGSASFWKFEHVLMLVRRQSEAEHRNFAPLKAFTKLVRSADGVFLGDPLVEGFTGGISKEPIGVAATLAKNAPGFVWKYDYVPGPHRYLPIFKMLSELESIQQSQNGAPFPGVVVICLGSGDVARQTPIYTFDRALDALLARLKSFGARKIVIAGVVPEAGRDANAEPYQQRVLDLQRQHHVESVDILHAWTAEANWVRRYALDGGAADASSYGPLPNGEALVEIAKMIEERLH